MGDNIALPSEDSVEPGVSLPIVKLLELNLNGLIVQVEGSSESLHVLLVLPDFSILYSNLRGNFIQVVFGEVVINDWLITDVLLPSLEHLWDLDSRVGGPLTCLVELLKETSLPFDISDLSVLVGHTCWQSLQFDNWETTFSFDNPTTSIGGRDSFSLKCNFRL